jgi:multisubunit Na+/H+ antiporter MnhC subunit
MAMDPRDQEDPSGPVVDPIALAVILGLLVLALALVAFTSGGRV